MNHHEIRNLFSGTAWNRRITSTPKLRTEGFEAPFTRGCLLRGMGRWPLESRKNSSKRESSPRYFSSAEAEGRRKLDRALCLRATRRPCPGNGEVRIACYDTLKIQEGKISAGHRLLAGDPLCNCQGESGAHWA